jgi:hypothetical protein
VPEGQIEEYFRKSDKDKPDKRRVGPAEYLIDGKDETAWSSDRGPGRRNTDSMAVLQFKEPFNHPVGTKLKITFKYKHGGSTPHGVHNNFLGRFRLATTTAAAPKADTLPPLAREALDLPPEQRTSEQQVAIASAWLAVTPELKPFHEEQEQLWAKYPEAKTSILNLEERPAHDSRETFLLDRGGWDKPKAKVPLIVPAFLQPFPEGAPKDRLGFAQWASDLKSPLVARVAVNRVWQALFGLGLVETADDFGMRSPLPSHPEVLDWLASDFTESGGSSRTTPDLLERDPQNRLLARGPRFRVDAEVVRDIALAASGLLNDQVGGPSIYPPVPESLFASSFLEVDFWKTAQGPERYRRSLYVFRRRSMPDPVLSNFDAPNGDSACVRRPRSNTPLAALTAMNEPVFVEAARALAVRTLHEAPATDDARATHAFRLCTGREPRDDERAALLDLLRSRKEHLAEGWISARELATGSGSLPSLPPGTTPADAAAWTVVARVLLNLDETLTKS